VRQVVRAVERYDSRVVHHLVQDDHVVGSLEELHVVVVGARVHRGTGVEAKDAALEGAAVLRAVRIAAKGGAACGGAVPRGRRQRRQAAVGRIDEERRPQVAGELPAVVPPEVVVAARQRNPAVGPRLVLIEHGKPLLRELRGFLRAEHVLVGKGLRPLERRQAPEVPDSLQVGATVRGARRLPRVGRVVLAGSCSRDEQRGGEQHGETG
jgi:hypothetical protein